MHLGHIHSWLTVRVTSSSYNHNKMSLQCELWILETKSSVNIPFSFKRLSWMELLLCDLYKGARANDQIHVTQWIQSLKGVCQEFSLMYASWLFQILMMFKATIYSNPNEFKLFISGWLWLLAESGTVSSCHISYMDIPAVLVSYFHAPYTFHCQCFYMCSLLVVYCEVLGQASVQEASVLAFSDGREVSFRKGMGSVLTRHTYITE